MKNIFKILFTVICLCALTTGCKDGIVDQSQYNGSLPALNFDMNKQTIEETATTPITIAMAVYGDIKTRGRVKIKVTPSIGVVYGVDFTTTPAAVDGYITLDFDAGQQRSQITMSVHNDLSSVSDKTVTLNLCEGSGGIQAGGKYINVITIKNMNSQASWLVITPSLSTLSTFGSVDKGNSSLPKIFSIVCLGAREEVSVTAPANYKISTAQTGTYSNVLYFDKAAFDSGASVDVWVMFVPSSGIDGDKGGNVVIKTSGTSGINVAVTGKETGNSGPYFLPVLLKEDGFWNLKNSVVGNKAAMVWSPTVVGNDGGVLYYRFNLTNFTVPMSGITKISFMFWAVASGESGEVNYKIVEIASDWKETTTIKPDVGGPAVKTGSVALVAGAYNEIDITTYAKDKISGASKIINFALVKTSGDDTAATSVLGANAVADADKWAKLRLDDI